MARKKGNKFKSLGLHHMPFQRSQKNYLFYGRKTLRHKKICLVLTSRQSSTLMRWQNGKNNITRSGFPKHCLVYCTEYFITSSTFTAGFRNILM